MAFSDLPLETIQSILQESIPESFDNLSLTCKTVYGGGRLYRDGYNELRRKYRRLTWEYTRTGLTLQLLLDIFRNPIVARYIEHADLRFEDYHHHYAYGRLPKTFATSENLAETKRDISNLVEQSECLHDAQQNLTCWFEEILDEYSDDYEFDGRGSPCKAFSTVLLLTLLPNLKVLTLPETWDPYNHDFKDEILEVLAVCIQNANNPSRPNAGLSNLTTLNPIKTIGFNSFCQLREFMPFFALTSLREFYCTGCTATDDVDYTSVKLQSNVERLEMGSCSLGQDEFVDLLCGVSSLKIFKYSFAVKNKKDVWAWDPAKFISALAASHGESLEELSISNLGDGCRELHGNGITSLKGFSKLKTLELDTRLLLGRRINDPNQPYPRRRQALAPCSKDLPTLLDLLPPSIKTLHLMIDQEHGPNCMERLVSDINAQKESILPNLSNIHIRCFPAKYEEKMTAEERNMHATKNQIWVKPILETLSSIQLVTYTEDFTLPWYDDYAEARFMPRLRDMQCDRLALSQRNENGLEQLLLDHQRNSST